jgi:L-seryl-tRNA(Ser) seleniumtransferase
MTDPNTHENGPAGPPGSDAAGQQDAAAPLQAALRSLPAVDQLLKAPAIANLLAEFPREELLHAVRAVLSQRREALRGGEKVDVDTPSLALAVREKLHERARPHLRRVINATGIVLHTGLGRAPLAEEAIDAIADVASGYCNLELDLPSGRRGDRHEHVRELLRELTGAEDALVVNNNAGGTFLTLHALTAEREVIVSRGQLVEIGGSYRMPAIMAAARCRMIEVGTTNRTHLYDYERAVSEGTVALLRVHTSNYRIQGFTESVPLEELVKLARDRGLLVIDDLGSGLIDCELPWPEAAGGMPAEPAGLQEPTRQAPMVQVPTGRPPTQWDEPSVRESVATGADVVLFSGDKLLGGPQAGVIVGRAELIQRIRKSPLARALRPDKMTLAGLEATLRLYRDPEALARRLPVFRMLSAPVSELESAAAELADAIGQVLPDAQVNRQRDTSEAGGGSLPTISFPTWTVIVRHPTLASMALAAALRQRETPVICRVQDEALVFDCRTLLAGDTDQVAAALAEAARELADGS